MLNNFFLGGAISVGGIIAGVGGVAVGTTLANLAGGSALLGAALGGGVAGGGYSYFLQKRLNPGKAINWGSVLFSSFAGALGGAISTTNAGPAAENIDMVNKGVSGALIDSVEPPPQTISAPPSSDPQLPIYFPNPGVW